MRFLRVKNWEKFQHYKKRNPPWIRLYNEVLDDYAFGRLQDASKWHAVGLWLLASRFDNRIPADPEWIGQRIGATAPVDLDELLSSGFITVCDDDEQDASGTLASRKQDATLEAEAETETETKQQRTRNDELEAERNRRFVQSTDFRAMITPLVYQYLWLGSEPPEAFPRSINQELRTAEDIGLRVGGRRLVGSLPFVRLVEDMGDKPVTMKLLDSANHQHIIRQALHMYDKQENAKAAKALRKAGGDRAAA
jgi:hypothetical protein